MFDQIAKNCLFMLIGLQKYLEGSWLLQEKQIIHQQTCLTPHDPELFMFYFI